MRSRSYKRYRWEVKMRRAGLCLCCGRGPTRESPEGRARLCEGCNDKQRRRMRSRGRFMRKWAPYVEKWQHLAAKKSVAAVAA